MTDWDAHERAKLAWWWGFVCGAGTVVLLLIFVWEAFA